MSALTAAPLSLPLGATVIAEVEAQNSAGYSTPSSPNTAGAKVEGPPSGAPTLASGSATSEA